MAVIDRATAFRLAEGTITAQVDADGNEHEPEFCQLERSQPKYRETTQKIRRYLAEQVKHCGMRRQDHEALHGLGEALLMSARLLTALEIAEGSRGGPVSSARSAFLSLGNELVGDSNV